MSEPVKEADHITISNSNQPSNTESKSLNEDTNHVSQRVKPTTQSDNESRGASKETPNVEETGPTRRFKEFTRESYAQLLEQEWQRRLKEEVVQEEVSEGRLVDGEIVFDEVSEEEEQLVKDPKLADGQPLPEKLGRFPKELDGVPLEELDPAIEDKTFIIVSKKFKKCLIFRFSASNALFCLSPWNPLRRFCLAVISNQWFDWFILLTIAVNCVFMMLPPDDCLTLNFPLNTTRVSADCNTTQVDYLSVVPENVFQSIYTLEMLLKIVARGFILNNFTYLRDRWNWLDFGVVLLAYITLIIEESSSGSGGVNLTGLRAFRVLRALKSISVVPGLRTIVNALLKSMKMLGEVMLLTLFCIAVFALLGLQLYKGMLKMKCVVNVPTAYLYCNATHPGNGTINCFDSSQTLETYWLQDSSNYLTDEAGGFVLCASTTDRISGCPDGYFCAKAGDNPNWNYTHFDQFPMAMLNAFQLVSLDFWEDTYDKIILVAGPYNILFFLMIVLLGSFYLLNLMLAVVFMAYEQEADVEAKLAKEKEEEEKQKAKRKENTAFLFDPKTLKQQLMNKQKEEAEKQKAAVEVEARSLNSANRSTDATDMESELTTISPNTPKSPQTPAITPVSPSIQSATNTNSTPMIASTTTTSATVSNANTTTTNTTESNATPSAATSQPGVYSVFTVPTVTINDAPKPTAFLSPKKSPIKRPTTAHGQFLKTAVVRPANDLAENSVLNEEETMEVTELEGSTENLRNGIVDEEALSNQKEDDEDEDSFYDDLPEMDDKTERYLVQKYATLWLNKIRSEEDRLIDRNCACCAKSGLPVYHVWMKLQNMIFKVANDGLFELFITICIAVNTAIMASEYYNVCELCRLCTLNTTCTICPSSCDLEVDSQREWLDGMPLSHARTLNIANIVFTVVFLVEAIIKLTALSKEYFNVGWNIFDLVIVALSLPDLVLLSPTLSSLEGFEDIAGIIKILRLLRIIKLAQSWSTMRTLLAIIFGAFGALMNLSLILLIVVFIFAVLGNQLFGPFYLKYEDIVTYPELADYGGVMPRWNFYSILHSLLMVFRILCGEWVEPLWDCMRVTNEAGCTFLFLFTLVLGNFMIFNLFLALLLNSFSSDKIKSEKTDAGDGKLKKSLKRIYHCFNSSNCCKSTSDIEEQSCTTLNGVPERKMSRLEAIRDSRKPSITINGSEKSIHSIIEATGPKNDLKRNVSSNSLMDDDKSSTDGSSYRSAGIELKPVMGNGHAKSRSGSIISTMSNGTGHIGNGVLKNKSPEMSPCNLRQIESAFSTHRNEYAKFETAGGCSNPGLSPVTPIIIAEDFSSGKSVQITDDYYANPEAEVEEHTDKKSNLNVMLEEEAKASISKDGEDEMLADDGHIVLPDCFCAVCHKNPKFDSCCPSTWSNLRMLCAKIITHKAFEGFILLMIAASTIALCFDDIYLHEKPELEAALTYLNIMFASFFIIEMILKMLALGIKKYFTGFWSILDFVIVCVSLTDIIGTYSVNIDISAFRAMRTLRALRPLRAVSRWQSMTIIVNALIFAMPAIANVLLVCVVFWLIFVIMGVQSFRGRFYRCEVNGTMVDTYLENFDCASVPLPADLTGYRFPPTLTSCNSSILTPLLGEYESGQWHWAKLCMVMGGTWTRPYIHFDNIGASYLALFQTATFEGWMEVMEDAIDHNPVLGGQSRRELSLPWYLYFVVFIIFGAFFTLNLFIGVIIDNFNVLKKKYDGSYLAMFLSDTQRHYYNTLKKLGNKKPQKTIRRPKSKIQAFFYDIAVNTKFEIGVTFVILLNMVAMMIEFEPQTMHGYMSNQGQFIPYSTPTIDHDLLINTLDIINIVFTGVFVIEAAIKIIGLRGHYFRRAWNVFDFVVVAASLVGITLDKMQYENVFISPTLLRVVRVFRIGRVLRLVKAAKGIRKLLFALVISMPALFNIATLLFLFMFIFAIVGMTFFATVKHQGAITATVNFETFGRSILLLFRLCTSGGWNEVLEPLMEQSNCNSTHYVDSLGVPQNEKPGNCSNPTYAVVFFLGYLFITFMVVINMYIAVILENFNQAHEQEEIGITDDDFDMFYAIWEKYDPHATQYIKLEYLSDFMVDLEAPLGVPKPNSMAIVAFNLPIVEGDRVHCLDILTSLVKRVLQHSEHEDTKNMTEQHKTANEQLKQQIAEKYKAAFPHRQNAKVLTTTMQRKKEDVAAKTLQRAWRKHKMKQNILRIRELALETTSHHGSVSRRVSDSYHSFKERLSSAVSTCGLSMRRASMHSTKSIASQTGDTERKKHT